MRIENRAVSQKDNLKKKDGVVKKNAEKTFMEALTDVENGGEFTIDPMDVGQEDLKSLADRIGELGENLSQQPSPDSFNQYKKHIRLFLKVLGQNQELNIIKVRTNKARLEDRVLIEEIDSDLAKLATLILSNEKNRLNYLKLTNNIRGLLIDLIM
jgi:uncharacterized protein YaaR (DUF327 family)